MQERPFKGRPISNLVFLLFFLFLWFQPQAQNVPTLLSQLSRSPALLLAIMAPLSQHNDEVPTACAKLIKRDVVNNLDHFEDSETVRPPPLGISPLGWCGIFAGLTFGSIVFTILLNACWLAMWDRPLSRRR
jgi:hypothetical protein